VTLTTASSADASESHAGVTSAVDGLVIRMKGEYDIATVSALSQTMATAIARAQDHLVVDLSGVQFMDAATIGVIIKARTELELQHRSLVLRGPSQFARRVLEVCGLTNLLDPSTIDSSTAGSPPFSVAAPSSSPFGDVGGRAVTHDPQRPGDE
jgi:anti-anti-sigma factor